MGNFSRLDLEAGISGPLIEGVLAAKISGFSYQRDGYVNNLFDGEDYMDDDRSGGRIGLYWTPSDTVEIVLSGDYLEQDNNQLFGQTLEPQLNNFIPGFFQSDACTVNQNDPNSEEIESGGMSLTVNWSLSLQ